MALCAADLQSCGCHPALYSALQVKDEPGQLDVAEGGGRAVRPALTYLPLADSRLQQGIPLRMQLRHGLGDLQLELFAVYLRLHLPVAEFPQAQKSQCSVRPVAHSTASPVPLHRASHAPTGRGAGAFSPAPPAQSPPSMTRSPLPHRPPRRPAGARLYSGDAGHTDAILKQFAARNPPNLRATGTQGVKTVGGAGRGLSYYLRLRIGWSRRAARGGSDPTGAQSRPPLDRRLPWTQLCARALCQTSRKLVKWTVGVQLRGAEFVGGVARRVARSRS